MTSLLDRIVRHQVYLESFKVGAIAAFNPYLRAMEDAIRREFSTIRVNSLDEMTKLAVARLVGEMRTLIRKQFNRYIAGMLKLLLSFLRGERSIFVKVFEDTDVPDADAMWSAVRNAPLPSNGQQLEAMFAALADHTENRISDTLYKAYQNSTPTGQALGAFVGNTSDLFGKSLMAKLASQNAAVVDTIIQHVSAIVQSMTASKLFDSYTWVSVIDKGTTAICVQRNGNVYDYGKGPLPPAHYRCRAMAVPGANERPATFVGWLRSQPEAVVLDMLGSVGKAFIAGQTKTANFTAFADPRPLSLDDFLGKLPFILE